MAGNQPIIITENETYLVFVKEDRSGYAAINKQFGVVECEDTALLKVLEYSHACNSLIRNNLDDAFSPKRDTSPELAVPNPKELIKPR